MQTNFQLQSRLNANMLAQTDLTDIFMFTRHSSCAGETWIPASYNNIAQVITDWIREGLSCEQICSLCYYDMVKIGDGNWTETEWFDDWSDNHNGIELTDFRQPEGWAFAPHLIEMIYPYTLKQIKQDMFDEKWAHVC